MQIPAVTKGLRLALALWRLLMLVYSPIIVWLSPKWVELGGLRKHARPVEECRSVESRP